MRTADRIDTRQSRYRTAHTSRTQSQERECSFLIIEVDGYGQLKFFSLDIAEAGVLDVCKVADNQVGYTFKRQEALVAEAAEGEQVSEAAEVVDTLGFRGLAVVKRTKGKAVRTKYVTFAEHEKLENELLYNLATETLTLRIGVRWWGESGLPMPGGVPLAPPEGQEHDVYSLVHDDWYAEANLPSTTQHDVRAAFPVVCAKQYR